MIVCTKCRKKLKKRAKVRFVNKRRIKLNPNNNAQQSRINFPAHIICEAQMR